ncbi:MAG: hypothetical protein M1828_000477 [Chrysothrix sp. TS-e1954]|nr:MAG: hypothetical protein M1828_000477 [Chrysothrix sp. TS-e1954]
MNFAPYQDEAPNREQQRAQQDVPSETPSRDELPAPEQFENNVGLGRGGRGGFGNGVGADERNVDVFGTSLPLRLDFEACLAYLLLPPAGGAMLLVFERKSDYIPCMAVKPLIFVPLLHLIFSFTKVVSFMLLAVDLILIAFLTLHAYKDAESLERCELPLFGRLASSFVDTE